MKHLIKSLLTATSLFFSFTSGAQYAHSVWMESAPLGTEANCLISDINGNGFILAGYVAYDSAAIYHVDNMGVEDWRKTFYNGGYDFTIYNIIHTQDGNYAAIGSKNFDGIYTTDCSAWLVKLDDTGGVIWEKTLGGSTSDILYDLKQTADGGYIAIGKTNSPNIPGYHNNYDMWIVKFDSNGNTEWQKAFGGASDDEGASIIQTAGGDYVALASTGSDDGDVSIKHGGVGYMDIWMVKFDNTGNITWEKTYGGTLDEWAGNLIMSDTCFMVLGSTGSNNDDISFNHGWSDVWVMRLDTMGTILWEKTYGGNSDDGVGRGEIKETTPGHFTIVTWASNPMLGTNGDLHCQGSAGWLFNIDSTGTFNWGWQYGGAPLGIEYNSGSYIVGGTYYPWPGIQSQYWVARVQEINILSCDPTLDVENTIAKNQQRISVYPTITNGKVNVDIPAEYNHSAIVITDLMGRSVEAQELSKGAKREVLIDGVTSGVYFLTVTSDHGSETFKIVYQP